MASSKITELNQVTNTTSDDYFYVSATGDGGSTYTSSRIKMSDFMDDIIHDATNLGGLRTDIDNLQSLTGRADGSTHMGTFTGSTLSDNQHVQGCLQELETYAEALWQSHAGDNVNHLKANQHGQNEPTNWMFLIVDSDNGNIKTLDKTFIEVE